MQGNRLRVFSAPPVDASNTALIEFVAAGV
jgi:hypothetical protein